MDQESYERLCASVGESLGRQGRAERGAVYTPARIVRFMALLAHAAAARVPGPRLFVDPAAGCLQFAYYDPAPEAWLAYEVEPAAAAAARAVAGEPPLAGRVRVIEANALRRGVAADEPGDRAVVVLGNPPWRVASSNTFAEADALVAPLRAACPTRNRKVLADDYIKFLLWAREQVLAAGRGAVCLVTNNNYFVGPTFSPLRWLLVTDMDEAYFLDLGGNRRRGEGDNPFGVQVGAGVCLLVKGSGRQACRVGRVAADEVDAALAAGGYPLGPGWGEPADARAEAGFWPRQAMPGTSVNRLFSPGSTGVLTGADAFLSDTRRPRLEARLRALFAGEIAPPARSTGWDDRLARTDLAAALAAIRPFRYRGLARKWLCYDPALLDGARQATFAGVGLDNPVIAVLNSRRQPGPPALAYADAFDKCALNGVDNAWALVADRRRADAPPLAAIYGALWRTGAPAESTGFPVVEVEPGDEELGERLLALHTRDRAYAPVRGLVGSVIRGVTPVAAAGHWGVWLADRQEAVLAETAFPDTLFGLHPAKAWLRCLPAGEVLDEADEAELGRLLGIAAATAAALGRQ